MIYFHSHLENECNLLSATIIKCPVTHSNMRKKNYSNKTVENFRFTLFCVRKHLEGNKILSVVCCLFVSCTSKEKMGHSSEAPFLFRRRSLQKWNNDIIVHQCLHVFKSFPKLLLLHLCHFCLLVFKKKCRSLLSFSLDIIMWAIKRSHSNNIHG